MMSLGQMQAARNKTENTVEQALWEIAMLLKAGQAAEDNGLRTGVFYSKQDSGYQPTGELPAVLDPPHVGSAAVVPHKKAKR